MGSKAQTTLSRPASTGAQEGTTYEDSTTPPQVRGPSLVEIVVVWSLLFAEATAVFITQSRLPLSDLYAVSEGGVGGGLRRVLVWLNFPAAFVAIALVVFAVARLYAAPHVLSRQGRNLISSIAVCAVGLALIASAPGVVNQSDLTEAKPINVLPAIAVMLALGVSIFAIRRTGPGTPRPLSRIDGILVGVAAALTLLGLPWILAVLGVYVGDVPVIGGLFMSKEVPSGETLRAVHLGYHHGLDGVLFAIISLVLIRPLLQMGRSKLRFPLAFFVPFMFVYGILNATQDFWEEQIMKRGWADGSLPSMLRPDLSILWGMALVITVFIALILLRSTSE